MATYVFTVEATDNSGASSTQTFNINVLNTRPERFVCCTCNDAYSSQDGINWTLRSGNGGNYVGYGNGMWIITNSTQNYRYSSDGAVWLVNTFPFTPAGLQNNLGPVTAGGSGTAYQSNYCAPIKPSWSDSLNTWLQSDQTGNIWGSTDSINWTNLGTITASAGMTNINGTNLLAGSPTNSPIFPLYTNTRIMNKSTSKFVIHSAFYGWWGYGSTTLNAMRTLYGVPPLAIGGGSGYPGFSETYGLSLNSTLLSNTYTATNTSWGGGLDYAPIDVNYFNGLYVATNAKITFNNAGGLVKDSRAVLFSYDGISWSKCSWTGLSGHWPASGGIYDVHYPGGNMAYGNGVMIVPVNIAANINTTGNSDMTYCLRTTNPTAAGFTQSAFNDNLCRATGYFDTTGNSITLPSGLATTNSTYDMCYGSCAAFSNGVFVVCGPNGIMSSVDGALTWTRTLTSTGQATGSNFDYLNYINSVAAVP